MHLSLANQDLVRRKFRLGWRSPTALIPEGPELRLRGLKSLMTPNEFAVMKDMEPSRVGGSLGCLLDRQVETGDALNEWLRHP